MVKDAIKLSKNDCYGLCLTLPESINNALVGDTIRVHLYVGQNVHWDSFRTGRAGNLLTDMDWPQDVDPGDQLWLSAKPGGDVLTIHFKS